MKVFLEMDRGPARGARFEVSRNGYRAIGRIGGDAQATIVVGDDRALDDEDLALVESHLQRRKGRGSGVASERSEIAFQRGADILLDDDLASRTHAMVFHDEDGPSVVDLGSTNGTFVNARTIEDADLVHGDVVHIGRTRFIVRVEAAKR